MKLLFENWKRFIFEQVNSNDAIINTKEFQNWFNNSKVVDESGNPLIVYHGTKKSFESFDRKYVGDQLGFHFGTKKQADWRTGDDSKLLAVYLRINNPLHVKDEGGWTTEAAINEINKASGLQIPIGSRSDKIVSQIKGAGYDGIIYKNRFEIDLEQDEEYENSYIVFDPTQIKSAFDNVGSFDSNNPSIYK